MSQSQKMMELVASYYCEPNAVKAGEMFMKLQAIANRQDRLLEIARFYLDELTYNDYVPRDQRDIAEVKKLIAECEEKDEQKG